MREFVDGFHLPRLPLHPTSAKRNFSYRMASLSPLPSGAAILCLKPHGFHPGFVETSLGGTPLASLQTGMFFICPTTGGSQLHVQENKPKGNPPVRQIKKTARSDDHNQTETVSTLDFSKSLTRCLRSLNKELVHAT